MPLARIGSRHSDAGVARASVIASERRGTRNEIRSLMHPAISLINALLLIVMLASGLPLAALLAAVIVLLLLVCSYTLDTSPDLTAVMRLRWLFLGILVLYLVFPPVVGAWQQELLAGLAEAGKRILALVLIVVLVQLLFSMNSREQVLAGLLWLLRPFAGAGLPVERFALRLMLVMEITPQVQKILARPANIPPADNNKLASRLRQLAVRLTSAFERVLSEAEHDHHAAIRVPVLRPPPAWQWLLPCLLAGIFSGIVAAA